MHTRINIEITTDTQVALHELVSMYISIKKTSTYVSKDNTLKLMLQYYTLNQWMVNGLKQ